MSQRYVQEHFAEILSYANTIEHRLDDSGLSKESLMEENRHYLDCCIAHNLPHILIDGEYELPEI